MLNAQGIAESWMLKFRCLIAVTNDLHKSLLFKDLAETALQT